MAQEKRTFLPALEGIRAYAFLLVFAIHYTRGLVTVPSDRGLVALPMYLLAQIAWGAVPVFFVLSGYLITGALFETRNRDGFFRVFYFRRAIRVLPLYYLTLIVIGLVIALFGKAHLTLRDLSYFAYLQNFIPDRKFYEYGSCLDLGHLWSLAVEEQFYLLWPVVIWFLRDRIALLRLCYLTIAGAFLLRVLWPLTGLSVDFEYECTLTRGDAIMMGCALYLHSRAPGFDLRRLLLPARLTVLAGVAVMFLRTLIAGQAQPVDYFGMVVLMPVINLLSLGLVVLAIVPGTLVSRACTLRWATSLGSMSYGLYVFHYPLIPFFRFRILAPLIEIIGRTPARLLMMSLAFALTYVLAWFAFHFVEVPALHLKNTFRYGPAVPAPSPALNDDGPAIPVFAPREIFGLRRRLGWRYVA